MINKVFCANIKYFHVIFAAKMFRNTFFIFSVLVSTPALTMGQLDSVLNVDQPQLFIPKLFLLIFSLAPIVALFSTFIFFAFCCDDPPMQDKQRMPGNIATSVSAQRVVSSNSVTRSVSSRNQQQSVINQV